MPGDVEVAGQLRSLANEPRLHGSTILLRRLADAVIGTHRDDWLGIDLQQVFDPGRCIMPVQEKQLRQWVHLLPHILIFTPIAITWFGLYKASNAFSAAVEKDPETARRSFLELWDTGMAGQLGPTWRFDHVALYAFASVALLFCAVAYSALDRRREDLRQEQEAARISARLTGAITDADILLTPHRLASPARFATELSRAAADLGRLLSRATAASELLLEASRGSERAQPVLTKAVTDLGRFGGQIEQSAKDLNAAVTELGQKASALGGQAQALIDAVGTGSMQLRGASDAAVAQVRRLQEHSSALTGQLGAGADAGAQLAAALRASADGLRTVIQETQALGSDVRSVAEAHAATGAQLSALTGSISRLLEHSEQNGTRHDQTAAPDGAPLHGGTQIDLTTPVGARHASDDNGAADGAIPSGHDGRALIDMRDLAADSGPAPHAPRADSGPGLPT